MNENFKMMHVDEVYRKNSVDNMLFKFVLWGYVSLDRIPVEFRRNREIYTAAFRYVRRDGTRHDYESFVEIVKMAMDDILDIAKVEKNLKNCVLKDDMRGIISVLQNYLSSFFYKNDENYEQFKKEIYNPFIIRLEYLLNEELKRFDESQYG